MRGGAGWLLHHECHLCACGRGDVCHVYQAGGVEVAGVAVEGVEAGGRGGRGEVKDGGGKGVSGAGGRIWCGICIEREYLECRIMMEQVEEGVPS